MNTPKLENVKTILVAVDFFEESAKAFRHACLVAKEFSAKLFVFHSCGTYGQEFSDYALSYLNSLHDTKLPSLTKLAEEEMKGFVKKHALPGVTIQTHVEEAGPIVKQILQYATKIHADFLVLGSQGRKGTNRLLLGSVAGRVLKQSKIPALVVREEHAPAQSELYRSYRKILIGTDFSEHSRFAVEQGLAFSKRMNAQVEILHVIDERILLPIKTLAIHAFIEEYRQQMITESKAELEKYIEGFTNAKDFVGLHVVFGTPAKEIMQACSRLHVDLVILGSHGHTEMSEFFLGSTVQRIAQSAPCPILMIP